MLAKCKLLILLIITLISISSLSEFNLDIIDYHLFTIVYGQPVAEISIAVDSGAPGCEETNECWIPSEIIIGVGETSIWSNDDTAAHTVTSGTPDRGPDDKFDSGLFMAGNTFSYTFDEIGEYPYFCMVHPWMMGTVVVNGNNNINPVVTIKTDKKLYVSGDIVLISGTVEGELSGNLVSLIVKAPNGNLVSIRQLTVNSDGKFNDELTTNTSLIKSEGIYTIVAIYGTQNTSVETTFQLDGISTTDTDNDGIIDSLDSCPTRPETFNNYQDLDGCPDTISTSRISIVPAVGSGAPGCEGTADGCYIPSTATVDVGGIVIFSNTDSAAHTFTSGTPDGGPDGIFDTSILLVNNSFEWNPMTVGNQPYFCMVHPWMQGLIIVQEAGADDDDAMMYKDGEASVTGMLSDGTMVSIWTSTPTAGEMMEIYIEFEGVEHVNHDMMVTQNGEDVLHDEGAHHHDGKGVHTTAALSSADPVDITITFQGYGVDDPKTGPIGEVLFSNVVPEFDTDNDGIIDSLDSCPTRPETFNNYQDLDGCPDTISTSRISIVPAVGSGAPGCEGTADGCYIPSTATVDVGGIVIFSNTDSAAHTFTSGDSTVASSIQTLFDSSLVMAGSTYEWSPTEAGDVPYFCMVHPWMMGNIIVIENNYDDEDPTVIPTRNITIDATNDDGAIVTYLYPQATDNVGVTSGPTCTPTSGSHFKIGITTVICTAFDAAGNRGIATFTITVLGQQSPSPFDYSLSVNPISTSIVSGQDVTTKIKINLISGEPQYVSLSCSSPNNNISCIVSPTTILSSGTTILSIKTQDTLTTGEYIVNITGKDNATGKQKTNVFKIIVHNLKSYQCKSSVTNFETDQQKYDIARNEQTLITISGTLDNYSSGLPAKLLITKPDNTTDELKTVITGKGDFQTKYLFFKNDSLEGYYNVMLIHADCKLGQISFDIRKNNDPPIITNSLLNYTIHKNESFKIMLSAHDKDKVDDLTFSITFPDHGKLENITPINNRSVSVYYVPDQDFVGQDAFEFNVTDGIDIATGKVYVTTKSMPVTGVNNLATTRSDNDMVSKIPDLPPRLTVPGDMIKEATSNNGVEVFFDDKVIAIDHKDVQILSTCTPSSGSLFLRGDTKVRCTVIDSAENNVTKTFTITVYPICSLGMELVDGFCKIIKDPEPEGMLWWKSIVENWPWLLTAITGMIFTIQYKRKGWPFTKWKITMK